MVQLVMMSGHHHCGLRSGVPDCPSCIEQLSTRSLNTSVPAAVLPWMRTPWAMLRNVLMAGSDSLLIFDAGVGQVGSGITAQRTMAYRSLIRPKGEDPFRKTGAHSSCRISFPSVQSIDLRSSPSMMDSESPPFPCMDQIHEQGLIDSLLEAAPT